METRSDFRMIRFNQRIGTRTPPSNFDPGSSRFMGDQTSLESFEIDKDPVGDGYLVIQVYGVDFNNHRILVNDRDLAEFDIARGARGQVLWQTWMDPIERGILRQGRNTIQVQHGQSSGGQIDNFIVRNVVVHWRESVDGGYQGGRDSGNHGQW
ncbi:DUF7383 domain-containing protein [Streptomyces spiramyceticus]|uniref:DUF7383 domain-containing protein n=1 Tax=Streptomyces spiramyceticus TaxID=299717 RepID=UPI00237A9E8E|nr:hypothetical protein [Streptomyces spiramyceticus]